MGTRKLRRLVLVLLCPSRPQQKGDPFVGLSFSGRGKYRAYSAPASGSRNPVEGGSRAGKRASFRASAFPSLNSAVRVKGERASLGGDTELVHDPDRG